MFEYLYSWLAVFNKELIYFIPAVGITLLLSFTALFFGLGLAFLFAVFELSPKKYLAYPATFFVALIRGLPELLIVIGVYNGIPLLINCFYDGFFINLVLIKWWIQFDLGIDISPFWCGVIALCLLYSAYASQTLRGAYQAIPKGQVEAAQVLCLSKQRTFVHIIMPQMWRYALPGLSNQWLVLLKDTALVSLISVNDIMNQAHSIAVRTHKEFTWYLIAALIYLIITLISQQIIKWLTLSSSRYLWRNAS